VRQEGRFAPQSRVVKRINRIDSNGNVQGAAYQRADAR
jgi:hypothetical protein